MADPEITILDDLSQGIIDMLERDEELDKLEWYKSEEFVPIDLKTNELNEICGSVELGREIDGPLENSGNEERPYQIECRITIWVPPKLRTIETPTLNEYRQRIKKVWNDAQNGTTDYPENVGSYIYRDSEPLTLGTKVKGVEKTVSKILSYEGYVVYIQDGF